MNVMARLKMRVLLVDDEAPARRRLRKLLQSVAEGGRLEVAGEAGDGVEALEALQADSFDLVFLDVQMPGLDGFEVLERLPPEEAPAVVFTTAYDAYALRAFEASAVDYLLKPVSKERLEKAIARAERMRRAPEARQASDERLGRLLDWLDAQAEQEAAPEPATASVRQISIPYRDRILIVPVARLVSAEIQEGVTRLYVLPEETSAGKAGLRQYVASYTLDQLEASLDPEAFVRVHRSALVQLDHIREMISWFSGRYKLVLTGGHEVIASRVPLEGAEGAADALTSSNNVCRKSTPN